MYGSNINKSLCVCILFHQKVEQTIECIRSVIASKIDIYILNNGSDSAARNYLLEFCNSYDQIQMFDSEVNLGVSAGRNFLINNTSHDWILFLDNDIRVNTSSWYTIICHYIEKSSDIEVFIPRCFESLSERHTKYIGLELVGNRIIEKEIENNKTNVFPGGLSFVSRTVFDRLGLYDEKMFIGLEDYEFGIRGLIENCPLRCNLISDIEMIHDHRPPMTIEDKNAVLTRYSPSFIENSLKRIREKYPEFSYSGENHVNWAENQANRILCGDIKSRCDSLELENRKLKEELKGIYSSRLYRWMRVLNYAKRGLKLLPGAGVKIIDRFRR